MILFFSTNMFFPKITETSPTKTIFFRFSGQKKLDLLVRFLEVEKHMPPYWNITEFFWRSINSQGLLFHLLKLNLEHLSSKQEFIEYEALEILSKPTCQKSNCLQLEQSSNLSTLTSPSLAFFLLSIFLSLCKSTHYISHKVCFRYKYIS